MREQNVMCFLSQFTVNFSLVDKDEDSVYFCGNSLGLLPKKTSVYIQRELDKWAQM